MINIRPLTEADYASFQVCLDTVISEGKWLALVKAPSLSEIASFQNHLRKSSLPGFIAHDDRKIVGWCEINPAKAPGFTHSGTLGMGLLPEYRGHGIGGRLLRTVLVQAEPVLERVDLRVFTHNVIAIHLYERLGFEREGILRRVRKVNGVYFDAVMMALLFSPQQGQS